MLTADHITAATTAAGAGSGMVATPDQIAALFDDAILNHGEGRFDTASKVASLVAECMMESAFFRATEEYAKNGRYAPYIGRTFIQLTWQANYAGFGNWCKTIGLVTDNDYFVRNPARLADLTWAALGGVYYFTQVMFHGKPLVDYADNILQVGRAVNLGDPFSTNTPNGQAARNAAHAAVEKALADVIVIGGKFYPPINAVHVVQTVQAQHAGYVSRNTWYVQTWLHTVGQYTSVIDGQWGPVTQAAFDSYRRSIGFQGSDATGDVGPTSLTRLHDQARGAIPVLP